MADSTCICGGSGFDRKERICVNHLQEAYLWAIQKKNVEMAACIVIKQRQLLGIK